MGPRQEDYRRKINGGKREVEILMRIVSRRTHGATCIMLTVASRSNMKGPFFPMHPRVFALL